jgi:homoserine dehydrogenase
MKQIPVIVFGAGGVGRALLQQISDSRERVAIRVECRFQVVGVVDSNSWRWQPAGLDDDDLAALLAAKKKGEPLGEPRPEPLAVLEHAAADGLEEAVVVDVTAAAGMEPMLTQALALGYGVALANKKPLAGPWDTAQAFYGHPRLRFESTVGGGQPVIATLRYLLDTNDPILRIEGQLSGTLGYICQRLDGGDRFSVALAAAKALGYAEPDPREDLGGRDVMRKLMILGRMAGWPLEEADIEVESLYSSALAHLDVQEFMVASMAMDPTMKERVNAAGAAGEVLRYVAELEDGQGRVGLKPVPMESPLANLKYISFRTERYDDEPLLIGGKGAGVEMTAAGVLGDMIALVRER